MRAKASAGLAGVCLQPGAFGRPGCCFFVAVCGTFLPRQTVFCLLLWGEAGRPCVPEVMASDGPGGRTFKQAAA